MKVDARRMQNASDDWLTPREWIEALGPFDLDPCASSEQPWWTAREMLTKKDDGLAKKWKGLVWCNPPYSDTGSWARKMAEHGNGFLMVFARTDTQWFHDWIWNRATSLFFPRGRITFLKPDGRRVGRAAASTVIAAYGERASHRICDQALARQLPKPGFWMNISFHRDMVSG